MTETTLINKVYDIANGYEPDIDDSTPFEEVITTLEVMKDKALKFELIEASFRPEPTLPTFEERRQGQL